MEAEEKYKKHLAYPNDIDLSKQSPLTHKGVIHIMETYYQAKLKEIMPSDEKQLIERIRQMAKYSKKSALREALIELLQ